MRQLVAGRAHSCISLVLTKIIFIISGTSSIENLALHGDKMGGKKYCRVIHYITGRMKVRNSAESLSFSFSNLKTKYRNRRCRERPPIC